MSESRSGRQPRKLKREFAALIRLMTNVSGPKSSKCRLLMRTVQSISCTADALSEEVYSKSLAHMQRRGALSVASAYRMVSEPAVLLIAGVIPLALIAKKWKAVFCRSAEVGKARTIKKKGLARLEDYKRPGIRKRMDDKMQGS